MAIVGGIGGYVNKDDAVVGSVRKWSISYDGPPVSYVASSTKAGAVRLAGPKDWSGSYDAMGAVPAVKPGDLFKFEGSIDGVNGAASAAAGTIVDSVVINWDIEAAGPITHTVSFSANGALTLGAVAGTADNSLPPVDLSSIIAVPLQASDALAAPSYSTIADVRTMQLTISRANPSYQSSSTGGNTKRVAGPWDAEFQYTLYEGDPANLFAPGTVKMLKAFINATLFWDLQFMRYGQIGGVECDIESGAVIGATQVCHLEGFTDISGTMTQGKIATPAAAPAIWWP